METNNHPNWLVPIHIARKLKEIGFDIPCTFLWDSSEDSNNLRCYLDEHPEEEGVYLPACFNYNAPNTSGYYIYTSLPTWEQVLEWFREKGFRIFLENHEDSTKFMFYNMGINEGKHFKGEYSNYEEAREALIREMINIYLIKKSKK